jgi:hypothetical protein
MPVREREMLRSGIGESPSKRHVRSRYVVKVPLLLGAKAEVVIGTLLVVRNRAVRIACGLALTTGVLLSVQEAERIPCAHRPATVSLIAGTLAAVAGSRLLAPGAALAASRHVATRWWLVPFGRLVGALLVVLPVVTVTVFALGLAEVEPFQFSMALTIYSAAVASLAFSFAPVVGSSAAVVATLVTVWIGALPTSAVQATVGKWPLLQHVLALLWKVFPLHWRVEQILTTRSSADMFVLIGWIVFGVVFSGWATAAVWPVGRRIRSGK